MGRNLGLVGHGHTVDETVISSETDTRDCQQNYLLRVESYDIYT